MLYPPQLTLTPRLGAQGVIRLPGSKSISNRMLLLAAMADGRTRLTGLLDSDDTRVMIDSLRKLGVSIQQHEEVCVIEGVAMRFPQTGSLESPLKLFIGNSGLTIRTLVPAVVASLASTGGCVELWGVPRMHERPIGDLVDGLRAIGARVDYLQREGFPPLCIHGTPLKAQTEICVKGSTSSQFLTGLLQAAPILASQSGLPVDLAVDGDLISKPYVDITLATLNKFGVGVERVSQDPVRYRIAPQSIRAVDTLAVEGDASSASYFLAAGLLGRGPLRVEGVGAESVQGDVRFADALAEMGAQIEWGPDWIEARAGQGIRGVSLDCNAIPDAAMTLAVVALFADSPTTLSNIGSWRVKETDRIAAMAQECRKFGAVIEEGDDWIRIHPVPQFAVHWGRGHPTRSQTEQAPEIETYDDHRVAMCFSLASFGPAPVTIRDPGCVAKTFPDFFEAFSGLCAQAVPVISIDGPTASGKGTIANRVAQALGFAYLDSGALYRLAALAVRQGGIDATDESAVTGLATSMPIEFRGQSVWLAGQEVTEAIRAEEIGLLASTIAVYPSLRRALLLRQRDFARLPGLVADGRDMGTVVFPQARLKIFLTATPRARAERRYNQLIAKGFSCNLDSLFADLQARDARDTTRAIAPLKPAPEALVIDSTSLTIDQVVQSVLEAWKTQGAATRL